MNSRLKIVSITGADDRVDPKELARLSKAYPFVEWAILLSANKQGLAPRYPSLKWMNELRALKGIQLAAHFCGGWARQIGEGYGETKGIQGALWLLGNEVNRIQLNISPYMGKNVDDYRRGVSSFASQGGAYGLTTIVQASRFSHDLINLKPDYRIVTLHDASGGRGERRPFEAPVEKLYSGEMKLSGFAGGINPDNVVDVLTEVERLGDFDFWIDMESGVRTDDQFDLDKVEKVLKICKGYIQHGSYNPL